MTEYTPRHAKFNRIKECFSEYALPLGILTGAIAGGLVVLTAAALKII